MPGAKSNDHGYRRVTPISQLEKAAKSKRLSVHVYVCVCVYVFEIIHFFLIMCVHFNFFSQIAAIAEQASETTGETQSPEEQLSNPLGWKTFNMRSVVSATEDLFLFILSDKGFRVRLFLVQDIIKATDVFLQDQVADCIFDEDLQARMTSESEVCLVSFSPLDFLGLSLKITVMSSGFGFF